MRIRFLQTLDSGVDGYPFLPGQVISVAHPPPWMLGYLDGEKAERLPDEEIEYPATDAEPSEEIAIAPAPAEQAVIRRGRRVRK